MSSKAGRRTLRERKVSQRISVVDETTRLQAIQSRLDALEADNEAGDDGLVAGSDDEEFVIAGQEDDEEEPEEEVAISGKRKRSSAKKGLASSSAPTAKRKTRAGVTSGPSLERKGPRSFGRLLEDAGLDKLPAGAPSYLTAACGPPTTSASRKFCSVCGTTSGYTCARCGSRYCCRRCFAVHTETRCLKMIS